MNPREKLATLRELLDEGLITKQDFDQRQKALLDAYLGESSSPRKVEEKQKQRVEEKPKQQEVKREKSPPPSSTSPREKEKKSFFSKTKKHSNERLDMKFDGSGESAFQSGEMVGAGNMQKTGRLTPVSN